MTGTKIGKQKRVLTLLQADFREKRISHAYLFYGPEGVGKQEMAQNLAQLLNCEAPFQEEPCGSCLPCRKIISGTHPDVTVIVPDGLSVKIEQVRQLQEKVYFKCYEGKYKVIMIKEAHLMTLQAANSLLKILEEPPEKTVFILLANDLNKVLVTIQSRCHLLSFADWGKEVEVEAQFKEEWVQLWAGIKKGDYPLFFKGAEMMAKEQEKVELVLEWLFVLYRQRLLQLASGEKNCEKMPVFSTAGYAGCFAAVREIKQTVRFLKNNVNCRLALEVLFLKLKKIEEQERGGP